MELGGEIYKAGELVVEWTDKLVSPSGIVGSITLSYIFTRATFSTNNNGSSKYALIFKTNFFFFLIYWRV